MNFTFLCGVLLIIVNLLFDNAICGKQPPKKCPKPNEHYACETCQAECATLGQPCPITKKKCTEACYCDEGFARNETGTCIPDCDCPPIPQVGCWKPNEHYECGHCQKECATLGQPCLVGKGVCNDACYCDEGFARAANGTCIPESDCPPVCPGPNEHYACEYSNPIDCSILEGLCISNSDECIEACYCDEGFTRDPNGTCIPECDCLPECPGPNEHYTCGNGCQIECSTLEHPCVSKSDECIDACYCDKSFARAANGTCIPEWECPPACPGPNEHFSCGNGCQVECSTLEHSCVSKREKCLDACYCDEGFARAANGTCIPECDCPPACPGPNEHFACGNGCQIECFTLEHPCVSKSDKCIDACYCDEGFARDANGTCIPECDCPPVCPGPNEHFACGNGCQIECSTLEHPCVSKNDKCVDGCYCDEGFVRATNGTCIPECDCPPVCPGPNEHYTCGNGCQIECSTLEHPCVSKSDKCIDACYCDEGFARDANGTCIPECDCPPACPGPNEHFSCGNGCQIECSTLEHPCVSKSDKCIDACYCDEGFARAANGTCIPECDCPPACPGPNEHFSCGNGCQIECFTLEHPCVSKLEKCVDACYCDEGFARAANGTCIPECDCPPACPGPNEHFSCGNGCQIECSTLEHPCVSKSDKCIDACYCDEGFARAANGTCIPECDCLPACPGPNEHFACGNGCQIECSTLEHPCVSKLEKCVDACYCDEGFARAANGTCIPECDCPPACPGPNEHYTCGNGCQPDCATLGQLCKILNDTCIDACYCDEGNVRDGNGVCIPECECPTPPPPVTCPGPNEHYTCGNGCESECATLGQLCPIPIDSCIDACYCDEGYARDCNGICIPECECPTPPPPDCPGPNEHYGCGNGCQLSCTTLGETCPIINKKCVDACYCNEGFVRDVNGVCIPECECPTPPPPINCTRPNEHYACGSACQNECATLGEICPIINIKCNDACYCDDGFARDTNGVCIPECECPTPPPPVICTGPNEHYACGSACQNACATLGEPCTIINVKCNDACYCDEGFARDANGLCIPECECPTPPPPVNCTGPNEHYACGGACQNECATLGEPCTIINIKCNDACYCDEGFARDANGLCIPECDCPPIPPVNCTGPNEHYECGSICQTECATLGKPCPIINIKCNDACYCDEGFARDANWLCIPECDCPPIPPVNCTGPNEHYECGSACQNECATLGQKCPIVNIKCNDACYCDEGFARDTNGLCIPECDCPPIPPVNCTGPNEHYECGSACQNECTTLGQSCPIVNIKCNDACYCDEGFARDANGLCIPECDCPPIPPVNCTAPNEHYECGSACQNECATLGQPCPIVNIKCNDACYCDEGFARDTNGLCIPECDCPPIPPVNCTAPNEHYECGSACQNECATLGQPCPIVNIKCNDACYCDEGFARDTNGLCIPECDCPPIPPVNCTAPNEHYECGSACQNECATLGQPCPIVNIKCNDACYCDEGFARDANGLCIPECDCPPIPPVNCTGPNEHYECGSACQNECATLGETCPIVNIKCNDACYCDEGFARDANGLCIPECECPTPPPPVNCTGPNEHYECGSACQNECATLGQPCPIVNIKCNDACYCDEGFARDANGLCIPECDCPPIPPVNCTGPNEHYECGSACQNECATLGQECPIVNIKCNDACYCDEGFARDANGLCIPECECPTPPPPVNCTGPNEHYACGSACQTECATLGIPCPIINKKCIDDCYCNKGYARNATGICIPQNDCTPACPGPHEHYGCENGCQSECASLGQPCSTVNIKCTCFCDKGYARDITGLCIPKRDCPPIPPVCPGKHEHYGCEGGCQNQCATLGQPCPIKAVNCTCFCDKGYARNTRGLCIPERDCPPIPPVCPGKHEHYGCDGECQNQCATLGQPCPIKVVNCTCFCDKGYARDTRGQCIPERDCPPIPPVCPGKHEHYGCDSGCQNKCATLGQPCPIKVVNCTCFCDKGYARNTRGLCIPERDCPPIPPVCPGKHEHYGCDSGCQNKCATLGQPCPMKVVNCTCFCDKGYARNTRGLCIPERDCPPIPPVCPGKHEHYGCDSGCQNKCATLGQPCPIKVVNCTCFCDKGYARNTRGLCIPERDCPPIQPECPGPNEHYICGGACQRECRNLGEHCRIPGINCSCHCKEGFARNRGVCIPEHFCPPKPQVCPGPNEHFTCGGPCEMSCETLDEPCPIKSRKCIEACYCNDGFVRNKHGKCIPKQICPPPVKCRGPNEHYICGSPCQSKCATLGKPCPIIKKECTRACHCINGFARDFKGLCIPEYYCPTLPPVPKKCTRPNEHYECGSPCQNECSRLGVPCDKPSRGCVDACYCDEGYARDDSGVCILECDCPVIVVDL